MDERCSSISSDSGTNSLLVTEVTSRLPSLLQYVRQLDVRTPQWVIWAPIRLAQPKVVTRVLRRMPWANRRLHRALLWGSGILADVATTPSWRRRLVQRYARWCLRAQVTDERLKKSLTPDYQPGCKRLIFSGSFYEAMQKPNADLVTEAIERVEPRGVVTRDGRLHELDVLILSTGFKADQFMRPMEMVGQGGLALADAWREGPSAYRSLAVPGMPNFFMLIGPHSPIGNLSLITIAERQADYIMKCIATIQRRGIAMAPKPEAVARLLAEMKQAAGRTVWSSGCHSWYLDKNGVPGIYPWAAGRFLREMKLDPQLADFELEPLPGSTRATPRPAADGGKLGPLLQHGT